MSFVLTGAFLSSCESDLTTTKPCDTCDTTLPCDTCDTTDPTPNPNDTTSHDFTWTEYSIPGEVNITGASIFGDNSIYVIGTHLHYFNGSSWTKQPVVQDGTGRSLSFPDFTMFGFSPNDIWIVSGGILDHYIGSGVAKEYRPGADGLGGGVLACWGTSSTDMFFVGKNGSISQFDGQTFTKFPQVTTKDLRSVWGTSHNDVWASGTNTSTGEVTLLHFDGSTWVEDPLAISEDAKKSGLFDVWTYDSSGHSFVVSSGSHVFRKTGSTQWRSDAGLIPNSLGGGSFVGLYLLKGNTANDLFATGGWGWVGHWNGKTWKKYDELYDYANLGYFSGALSVKGNTVCVVGSKSGASWIAVGRRGL